MTELTIISLRVSVPVLSVQMTENEPSVSTRESMPLMCPISVPTPAATTTPRPAPPATSVPLKAMQVRSPRGGIGGDGFSGLLNRNGFAGKDSFLDPEPGRLNQPQIGGNLLARLQKHDTTRHHLGVVDAAARAIAQNRGAGRDHLADGLHRLLGAALLDKADHRVGDDNRQDHSRIDHMPETGGDDCGTEKDVDQHIMEMRQEAQDRATPRRCGQAVRPMLR